MSAVLLLPPKRSGGVGRESYFRQGTVNRVALQVRKVQTRKISRKDSQCLYLFHS